MPSLREIPGLDDRLVRFLEGLNHNINTLLDLANKSNGDIKQATNNIPSIAQIRTALQANGDTPLNVEALRGKLAQSQLANTPQLSSLPSLNDSSYEDGDVVSVNKVLYIRDRSTEPGTWNQVTSDNVPVSATFITQTPDATLTNEQALSLLASGYMKSTTGTGVVATQAPPIPATDGGTGVDTSGATGLPLVAAGVWSFSNAQNITINNITANGTNNIFGTTGSNQSTTVLVRGTVRALRLGTSASVAAIEGVDQTGSGSYQSIQLGGADIAFTISGVSKATISSAGNFTVSAGAIKPGTFTVATLPTPSEGMIAYVTDGTGGLAWGATVTGGSTTRYLVWYNGTNWTVVGK